ncbi:hypothetical protein [Phenylobacterium sp.]|uniref:hypothetical protein n=1 Tax=Phenylobacterium sp. TaxID=1871053 RepID=UPI0035AF32BD
MWSAGTRLEGAKALNAVEMHDAQLVSQTVDYEAGTAVLMLRVYEGGAAPKRRLCRLEFSGVEAINQIADLALLKRNASAGNINAWRVHERPRKTYIDLTEGCIEVAARSVRLTVVEVG